MQISLCYSPALQRLSVVVLRARGLQLLPDAGMSTLRRLRHRYNSYNIGRVCWAGVCVQVSLQIHSQVVKSKRSCVVKGEGEPSFSHRTTFKLRPQHLEEACLRVELQQPSSVHSGGTLISLDFLWNEPRWYHPFIIKTERLTGSFNYHGEKLGDKLWWFILAAKREECNLFFGIVPPRTSSYTGHAGVGPLHVRQGPTATALDGHGQLATGRHQTVAWTGKGLIRS